MGHTLLLCFSVFPFLGSGVLGKRANFTLTMRAHCHFDFNPLPAKGQSISVLSSTALVSSVYQRRSRPL